MVKAKNKDNSGGKGLSEDASKILAALSYPIWIVALVTILIAKQKEKYAKYHGYQGLFWGIAMFLVYLVLSIPFNILWRAQGSLLGIAILGIEIYFAVLAYQGRTFKIPIIYNFIPASAKY